MLVCGSCQSHNCMTDLEHARARSFEPAIPSPPTFEHHREAFGIGERRPRISWKTTAHSRWRQVAYELEVARGQGIETSGRTESTDSVLVPWPTEPLISRESATVRVRVWGPRRPRQRGARQLRLRLAFWSRLTGWLCPLARRGLRTATRILAGLLCSAASSSSPQLPSRRACMLRRTGSSRSRLMAGGWATTSWRRGGRPTHRACATSRMTFPTLSLLARTRWVPGSATAGTEGASGGTAVSATYTAPTSR